jgi:hypothetical protein
MYRLSNLAALLAAVVLLTLSTPAQTKTPRSAPSHVERVAVRAADATDKSMAIEIQTSGAPVEPDTQVITGPDRIVVDFPGAVPAAQLRALQVNRGPLKAIRTGLFFNNPPITRIVLDLAEPQSYQISRAGNQIVVGLAPVKIGAAKARAPQVTPALLSSANSVVISRTPVNRSSGNPSSASPVLANSVLPSPSLPKPDLPKIGLPSPGQASSGAANSSPANRAVVSPGVATLGPVNPNVLTPSAVNPNVLSPNSLNPNVSSPATLSPNVGSPNVIPVSSAVPQMPTAPIPAPMAEEPPKPMISVNYANQMLSIRAEHATLAQVLFEVQRLTQADIAIPAGAEQEQIIVNLGPAPARDVLASLLNGSPYNFIFVGSDQTLERVILTRRDPDAF